MSHLKFFIDFDGTVSTTDVVDLILERFAPEEWRAIEREWAHGLIGSRECLSRQLALVKTSEAAFHALIDTVRVDPGFGPFLRRARGLGVPVTIVSDGLDSVIRRVLQNALPGEPELLDDLPIYSNALLWTDPTPLISFSEAVACAHGCANCKERVISRLSSPDDMVLFVGDGLSDCFAAKASRLTFAKGKLLEFCRKNNLPHRPYASFHEIEKWLAAHCASTVAP